MFSERTKLMFCMIVSQLTANYIWKLISRFMFQVKMDQRLELEDLSYGVVKTEVLESDEQLFTGEWVSEGSQIRIRLQIRLHIRILTSTSKKIIKNLNFCWLVTFYWLFMFKDWCKCAYRNYRNKQNKSEKTYFLVASWKSLTKRAGSRSVN